MRSPLTSHVYMLNSQHQPPVEFHLKNMVIQAGPVCIHVYPIAEKSYSMCKGHLLPEKSKWNKKGSNRYVPNHQISQSECLGVITGKLSQD